MQATDYTPVIVPGVIKLMRTHRGYSQDTYVLNPEAAQFSDAALASWCDDGFRWGEDVVRYRDRVEVTVYRD